MIASYVSRAGMRPHGTGLPEYSVLSPEDNNNCHHEDTKGAEASPGRRTPHPWTEMMWSQCRTSPWDHNSFMAAHEVEFSVRRGTLRALRAFVVRCSVHGVAEPRGFITWSSRYLVSSVKRWSRVLPPKIPWFRLGYSIIWNGLLACTSLFTSASLFW